MRGITLVHVQTLGHGHARDAMPADVIANACNARRWVGAKCAQILSTKKWSPSTWRKSSLEHLKKISSKTLRSGFFYSANNILSSIPRYRYVPVRYRYRIYVGNKLVHGKKKVDRADVAADSFKRLSRKFSPGWPRRVSWKIHLSGFYGRFGN